MAYTEPKIINFIPLKNPVRAVYDDDGRELKEDIPCLLLIEQRDGKREVVYGTDQYADGKISPFEPVSNFLRFETGEPEPTPAELAKRQWDNYLAQHQRLMDYENNQRIMSRQRSFEDRITKFEQERARIR